jgi:CRISPR-associated endonuclease/helicase Cas3
MDTTRLWAKSQWKDEPFSESMLFAQHLKDVHSAAGRVLDATAPDQLAALRLDRHQYEARFRRCVLLAAAVHDLGKANDHFQGMIVGSAARRDRQQGLRHEWVSLLIMLRLRDWLLPAVGGTEPDFAVVQWAVTGHHPAHNHDSPPKNAPPGSGTELTIYTGHDDFKAALRWLETTFQLNTAPTRPNETSQLTGTKSVCAEIMGWVRDARRIWENLCSEDRKLTAAVKNALVAADIAGSALPKKTEAPDWDWITRSFDKKPTEADLNAVIRERRKDFQGIEPEREEFQAAVENSPARVTFVKAGCGSGKTLAAYMWAAKNYPTRRLFFCYPTTGTATEGFKDYLFVEDVKEKADLFHSRRDVDFEIVMKVKADAANAEADAALRIDALDSWATPIVACTVDTVLGIVQNNKRGLFAWPALAQSAFVFDEIHAYDDRLFGALLRFLRDLPGLPVLLMTASLPDARHRALEAAVGTLKPIPGPADLEGWRRYKRHEIAGDEPLAEVKKTFDSGGKVLWVCNTVARVMDAARRATEAGLTPLIYHSRFKYEDRVQRHKAVIDAFKREGPALAICSQVAEMSLDLSANLLVTDLAPVPALIQRMGRLNRRAKAHDPWPFVVVEPESHLPYTPDDLAKARAWLEELARLCAEGISQADLASAWEQTGDQPPALIESAWLDGGPTTTVTELREASPGITVLMREDVPAASAPKQLGRFVLPMPPPPRGLDWRAWPKLRGVPIAEPGTILYDKDRGATWAAVNK